MKIALVYPKSKTLETGCFPPISLISIATVLKKNGLEVKIFDPDAYAGDLCDVAEDVLRYDPGVIGISVLSDMDLLNNVEYLCKFFKEKIPLARIVLGGAHATAMPHQAFERYPEADYVLAGEAEFSFLETVRQIAGNKAVLSVPGLYQREDGQISLHAAPEIIKNLDLIPVPDRTILSDNYKRGFYWRVEHRDATDILLTSRGCPFDCRFCYQMTRTYRMRSQEQIIEELGQLARMNIRNVHIEDDLFTANKQRVAELCQKIRKMNFKFHLKVRSRVNSIDDEMLEELKKTGVFAIVYGIESGSQTVLNAMGKKVTVQQNMDAIRKTHQHGLKCYADMFVGYPGETPETIEETKRFLLRAKPFAIGLGVMIPFPETFAYKEAQANGSLAGDWNTRGDKPFIKTKHFPTFLELALKVGDLKKSFYSHPVVAFRLVIFFLQNILNARLRREIFHNIKTLFVTRTK